MSGPATHRLVLLRHGESAWNRENRFTGWRDVPLSETVAGWFDSHTWPNSVAKTKRSDCAGVRASVTM